MKEAIKKLGELIDTCWYAQLALGVTLLLLGYWVYLRTDSAGWAQAIGTVAAIVFAGMQSRYALVESDKRHTQARLDGRIENYERIQNFAKLGLSEMNRLTASYPGGGEEINKATNTARRYFEFVNGQLDGISVFDLPPGQIVDLVRLREVVDFCIDRLHFVLTEGGYYLKYTHDDVNKIVENLENIDANAENASFCDIAFGPPPLQ